MRRNRRGKSLALAGASTVGLFAAAGPAGRRQWDSHYFRIGVKTGDQPIANEDGTVWVVFNGEIYNYRELTADLLARGHRFATASDTEVLLHLYEEQGEECVEHLRGMFAFAIWDARRRTLFLARDRPGIKPLYYADTPQGLVFGSELKVVVKSPWVARRVDPAALTAYLRWGYVPDPLSILEGVRKLPPGHTLTVRNGRPDRPRRYWDPAANFTRSITIRDEQEAVEALWERVASAVRSHLVSDVPVGAFLSGGVDSSAVLAVMAAEAGDRVKTFSIGFREPDFDESPYARRVAEWFGTEHHELVAHPADLDLLDQILSSFDEPFADASAIPTFLVSRLARQHVKVVLSGDGGDEIFAGYDRYVADWRRRRLGLLGDLGVGGGLRLASALLPEGTPGKNYLYNLSLPRMERYLDLISTFPPQALGRLLDPEVASASGGSFADAVASAEGLDPLSRLQALDLLTYLPGDILTKVDRMSMANSLEARVPLLDHHLVEFACALPPRLRMRAAETKYLLKRVLRGKVPLEVLERPMQGFGVPLEAWFTADLPGFYRDVLGDGSRLHSVGIRPAAVQTLLEIFQARGRLAHCRRLWSLVVIDAALRRLGVGA